MKFKPINYYLYLLAAFVCGCTLLSTIARATPDEEARRIKLLKLEKSPSIVMFYSRDCAPCHIEMNMLPELKQAMEGDHITVVSLTSPDKALVEKLKGLDIQLIDASDQDPSALLRAFNDQHLALPFSFTVDGKGTVCARRAGLLGLDIIKDWRKQCSQ